MSALEHVVDRMGRGLAGRTSRRGFLRGAGAAAGLVALPGIGRPWGAQEQGPILTQAPDLSRCYGQGDVNLCFSAWRVKPDLSPYPELAQFGGGVPMNWGPVDGREAGLGYLQQRAGAAAGPDGRFRGPEVFLPAGTVFARQSTRNPTDRQPRPRRAAKGTQPGQRFMFGYGVGVTGRVGWVDLKYLESLGSAVADPKLCGPDGADFDCRDYGSSGGDGRAGGRCGNEVNGLAQGDITTQFEGTRYRVVDHVSCESTGDESGAPPIWEAFVSLRYATNSSAFAYLMAGDEVEMIGSKDVGQSRCGETEIRWRCVRVTASRTYPVGGRGWVSDDVVGGRGPEHASLQRI